jgi:hypothetical protein
MGWMVRASSSGGEEIFSVRPDWVRGPHSLPCNGYRGPFPGVKWSGHGIDHPPHLLLKLQTGYSYSSTSRTPLPPCRHYMLQGKRKLYLQGTPSQDLQLTTYPPSAKIKNKWSSQPFPHMSLL